MRSGCCAGHFFMMGKALRSVAMCNAWVLKRIVETGKHGGAFTAVADIDITNDRRSGNATECHATDLVKPVDRKVAGSPEHLAHVHERRDLEVDVRRLGVESPDGMAHLGTAG